MKHALSFALMCMMGIVVAFAVSTANPTQLVISAPEGTQNGRTLQLTATLKNLSDHNVKILHLRGDSIAVYRLTVRNVEHNRIEHPRENEREIDGDGDTISMFSLSSITLKAGEDLQETIDLGRMYDLAPGTYTVQVERYVPEEKTISPYMISNQIKVEVTAPFQH
jgi:hypothetical protein